MICDLPVAFMSSEKSPEESQVCTQTAFVFLSMAGLSSFLCSLITDWMGFGRKQG